jgi:CrcB protein
MLQLALIALGGALGAVGRFLLSSFVNHQWPHAIQLGTITVNVLGSFVIGLMYVLITEKAQLHPDWRNIVVVGFLGAFTTFSTFSLETVTYIETGKFAIAGIYVALSLLGCFVATAFAIALARHIL